MPGVVGVFSSNEIFSESRALVSSMCNTIKHMPNQEITTYQYTNLTLGRVDLGIYKNIKPKENDTITAFIWGELLNPQKERREILKDFSYGDEKIDDLDFLVSIYKKSKRDFAHYLRGSFNAFIFDKKYKKLIIVNDRFGLRPLYYNHCGNEFVFASEVKALLKYNGVRKSIDPAGVADFFHFGFLTGTKTFFSGIEMLPPSTVLTFEDGYLTTTKYWDLTFSERSEALTACDYIDQLANVIKDCIRVNMEGDFRFGLPLSGGLDSRTIAACIPKEKHPILVYTWGMENSPEVQIAKRITEKLSLDHHNIHRTPEQFVENFEKSVTMTDGMIAGHLPLSNFLFEAAFMPHVDICFDGLQSICAMYPLGIINSLEDDNGIFKYLMPSIQKQTLKTILSEHHYKTFTELALISREKVKASINDTDPINRYHYFDITQKQRRLDSVAHCVKRNFVEIRTPLFDYPIIDLIQRIPSALRKHRYIYYKAFCHIAPELAKIKNAGTMLPVNYPHWLHTLGRIKKGLKLRIYKKVYDNLGIKYNHHNLYDWGIDYDYWYTESAIIRNFIRQTLTDRNIKKCEYFNPEGVRQILDAQFRGEQNYIGIINRILTYVIWSKKML